MGRLFAALLALDEVARVVLRGGDRLAAHLGSRGELLLHRAAGFALRGVPLDLVTLLKLLLRHHGPPFVAIASVDSNLDSNLSYASRRLKWLCLQVLVAANNRLLLPNPLFTISPLQS